MYCGKLAFGRRKNEKIPGTRNEHHIVKQDKHYDKKYEDMKVRLDKLYDEIEEIDTLIEEVETRLYNIRQEKISGDNVYQFLLFFDKLYDRFTDIEKKTYMNWIGTRSVSLRR